MAKESLYRVARKRLTEPKNVGYAYEGNIMANSIDPELRKNPKIADLVAKIDAAISDWIGMVKKFKVFRNIYMDKDETQFN